MEPCIPTDNSLANPSIYTTVLHTLTCTLVPVNLFGAYCILFKTPKKMKSVKWLMLSLHCFSFLLDFSVSFLGIPYVLYPAIAGYGLGQLDYFRVQIYLLISSMDAVGVAIVMLVENRYYVLFGRNTWWEKVRKPILIIDNLLIPLFILPVMFTRLEREMAIKTVSEMLPCSFPLSLNNRDFFVFVTDFKLIIACIAPVTISNVAQVGTFSYTLLIKLIKRQSSVTSAKTNELQKKFVIALILQTLLPFAVLLIPIIYKAYSILFNYHNQQLNNLTFCLISVHGLLSTVIMISVHQPYRDFVIGPVYQLIVSQGTMIMGREARVSVVQLSVVQ